MLTANSILFSAVRAGSVFVATLCFCALVFASPGRAADIFEIVEKGCREKVEVRMSPGDSLSVASPDAVSFSFEEKVPRGAGSAFIGAKGDNNIVVGAVSNTETYKNGARTCTVTAFFDDGTSATVVISSEPKPNAE